MHFLKYPTKFQRLFHISAYVLKIVSITAENAQMGITNAEFAETCLIRKKFQISQKKF